MFYLQAVAEGNMRFSIYGRFLLDVVREKDLWAAYRVTQGLRIRVNDFIIPSDVSCSDIAQFLDDIFHELSGPGDRIHVVE